MRLTEDAIKVIQEQHEEILKEDESNTPALLIYQYYTRS